MSKPRLTQKQWSLLRQLPDFVPDASKGVALPMRSVRTAFSLYDRKLAELYGMRWFRSEAGARALEGK